MTFTEAQTTAFFQGADQMALNERTRGRLAVEGLETVQDLVEFDDDSFKQLVENLRPIHYT
jgi:bifunctional ADP-heptose synthase (sugar kinase/adenylyltransferase)